MNYPALISASLDRQRDKIVLIQGARKWTARGFNRQVDGLARSLAALFPAGSRILMFLSNSAEFVITQFALERAGLIRMPLNSRSTVEQVRSIIDRFGPALIFGDASTRDRLSRVAKATPCCFVDKAENGDLSFADLLRGNDVDLSEVPGDAICSINFTSGSSGEPKGVVLTFTAWAHVARNMLVDRQIEASDRFIHIGPLSHASGAYLAPYFLRGATNIIVDYKTPSNLIEAIDRHRATSFACVPTVLQRLLNDPEIDRHDLSSLRQVIYGAEPIGSNTLTKAWNRFGTRLVQNYGLTEAMMTVAFLDGPSHVNEGKLRCGAIGRPYSFVETRIVDADGQQVPQGGSGELQVRSDNLMRGYWDDEQATRRAITDGWLRTGDIVRAETDGTLFLEGRAKDIIISGGFNVVPREVELFLTGLPGVAEAAVIGVPDEQWGERVVAFIAPSDENRTCGIEAWQSKAKSALGIRAPKQWELRPALPRTANGKIDKLQLKRELVDAAG